MKTHKSHISPEAERTLLQTYYKHGDLDVLGKLYAPYMYMVLGVCMKYLKHTEQAQDAVMQIFEELVDKLRVHQVHNFRSWLYTYARNYCLMVIRKKQQFPQVELSEDLLMENLDDLHLPNKEDMQEAQLQAMEACIDTLNAQQKHCVELFFLKNKCYKEIGEETGYTLKQVKSYIQNGKRNIRICMERKNEQNV